MLPCDFVFSCMGCVHVLHQGTLVNTTHLICFVRVVLCGVYVLRTVVTLPLVRLHGTPVGPCSNAYAGLVGSCRLRWVGFALGCAYGSFAARCIWLVWWWVPQ